MKKLLFLYTTVLFLFTVFSYLFVDPNLVYLHFLFTDYASQNRELVTGGYILFLILLFGLYFYILRVFQTIHHPMLWFKRYVSITVGMLLLSYPAMLSYDIFNYIFTAKVFFFYHENPYIVMPIAFTSDPLLLFTHAANKIALYGPFWIVLSGIPYVLGFGNFLLLLLNFKLVMVGCYLGTLWVLWKLTKNIKVLTLFAFNPLVIIETLVSSHNDIVMVFFTLLSFLFLKRKKLLIAVLFFILAGLIKYAIFILLPVFLYLMWKTIKKDEVVWEDWYYYAAVLLLIFMVIAASVREEIYPWYALWFLSFAYMVSKRKTLLMVSQIITVCLMLRYIPFMFLGTHNGSTPFIKLFVTFVPVFCLFVYMFIKKYLWVKK